jgi:hypothetical protein
MAAFQDRMAWFPHKMMSLYQSFFKKTDVWGGSGLKDRDSQGNGVSLPVAGLSLG